MQLKTPIAQTIEKWFQKHYPNLSSLTPTQLSSVTVEVDELLAYLTDVKEELNKEYMARLPLLEKDGVEF